MGRLVVMVGLMATSALFTAGCQTLTGKTAGPYVDDAALTASVKAKRVADNAVNLTHVDVDANDGVVYLNGVVSTPEERAKTEEFARETHGVRRVVNNLRIEGTRTGSS